MNSVTIGVIVVIILLVMFLIYINWPKPKEKTVLDISLRRPDFSKFKITSVSTEFDAQEYMKNQGIVERYETLEEYRTEMNQFFRVKLNWENPSEKTNFVRSWNLTWTSESGQSYSTEITNDSWLQGISTENPTYDNSNIRISSDFISNIFANSGNVEINIKGNIVGNTNLIGENIISIGYTLNDDSGVTEIGQITFNIDRSVYAFDIDTMTTDSDIDFNYGFTSDGIQVNSEIITRESSDYTLVVPSEPKNYVYIFISTSDVRFSTDLFDVDSTVRFELTKIENDIQYFKIRNSTNERYLQIPSGYEGIVTSSNVDNATEFFLQDDTVTNYFPKSKGKYLIIADTIAPEPVILYLDKGTSKLMCAPWYRRDLLGEMDTVTFSISKIVTEIPETGTSLISTQDNCNYKFIYRGNGNVAKASSELEYIRYKKNDNRSWRIIDDTDDNFGVRFRNSEVDFANNPRVLSTFWIFEAYETKDITDIIGKYVIIEEDVGGTFSFNCTDENVTYNNSDNPFSKFFGIMWFGDGSTLAPVPQPGDDFNYDPNTGEYQFADDNLIIRS